MGRRVAHLLARPFIDTDAEITKTSGTPSEIFATKGEAVFRTIEEAAVTHALEQPVPSVISLGGGAILSEETRQRLESYSVVLLTTDQETVLARANLEKRPLLRDDPAAWNRIYQERLPFYRAVADVEFDTRTLPKDHVAQQIVDWLKHENRR